MATSRDNFNQKTISDLSKEVAGVCSNPDCNIQTLGPNNSKDGPAIIGVAAHITAASENGPRYDASLTTEQRRSSDNGIWLCQKRLVTTTLRPTPSTCLYRQTTNYNQRKLIY